MIHAPHLDLFRRLTRELDQPPAADAGIVMLSTDRYLDPARLVAEKQKLFGGLPLLVAHGSELPPGHVMAFDRLDLPVILTRGKEGQVRAFVNACRHRGTRLVSGEAPKSANRIICPYHAWSYRLSGALAAVPLEAEAFPGLNKSEYGLMELPAEERGGFIWLMADREGRLDLEDYLGDLAGDFEALGVAGHVVFAKRVERVPANWKLISDAFHESYHVKRLHSASLAGFFKDSIVVDDWPGLHARFAIARTDLNAVSEPADAAELRNLVTFAYTVFPNTTLIVSPDYINVLTFYPVSAGETVAVDTMLIPEPPANEAEREHWQRSSDLIHDQVFAGEDFRAAALCHEGIAAGITELTIGHHERGILEFHRRIDEALGSDAPAHRSA